MRTTPPLSSSPLPFHVPHPLQVVLHDGTPVYHVHRASSDITTVVLHFHAGGLHAPVIPGSTAMAMEMLVRGTQKRTMQEFAEAVEQLGGQIRSSTNRSSSSIAAVGLTEHAPALLRLMAEAVSAPRMDPAELEAARAQWMSDLRMEASDPMWLASRALQRTSFSGHPYELPSRGTVGTLESLTLEVVHEAFAHLRRAPRTIIVSGGATLTDVLPTLEELVASLESTRAPDGVPTPTVPRRRAGIVEVADAVQTALAVSLPGPLYHSPDFPAVRLITTVLGGYALGRLFTVLREEKGYTYGAYAGVDVVDTWGTIDISTSVGTDATADTIATIGSMLDQLCSEPIPDQELDDARQHLLGSYARAMETPQQVASAIWRLLLFGLPMDYYETTVQTISQLQAAQLESAQQTWFQQSSWLIGASGHASTIASACAGHVDDTVIWTPLEFER